MKLGKKFLIYLFCGLLTFSVVSSSYYKTVHAFEYVGGALAFDTALKWLLATIGITATAGMTDAYWDTYGDEFTDYAIQNGATQQEVAEWQLKACEGVLDKASDVWTQFKNWAKSLISSGNTSGSFVVGSSYTDTVAFLNNYFDISMPINNSYINNNVYGIAIEYNDHGKGNIDYYLFIDSTYNYSNLLSVSDGSLYFNACPHIYTWYNPSLHGYYSNFSSSRFSSTISGSDFAFSENLVNDNLSGLTHDTISVDSGTTTDTNFNSLDGVNTDDLDVISSDGVNEADDEVTLPYPGVSDSDNTLSNDAYQDIVDKINDGTITQEQGIEHIQELLRVITYDTVTDEVVPPQKNDDGTNKTKDDALKENKENAGFTLGGLENVFPFCIPFDIYAFMTLLVAEPECPEFDFPIKTVNGQEENIHVDLEPFEPVAVVVRYVFDFLFIVGLAILTRSLIGGGSSD